MAHELAVTADGRSAMAYVGEEPWHGLGQKLTPNSPLEVWAEEAGLNFSVNSADVKFDTPAGQSVFDSKRVLYRSDNQAPLAVVGSKYKVVQPIEVLEFFRNLTVEHGWSLETAGVLFNGAKYWALARTGQELRVKGQDLLQDYVMLATACDGTLKTVAKRTSVRVVCNNTLTLANMTDKQLAIKVSHASNFDAQAVQAEMGLTDSWSQFSETVEALASRKVTNREAVDFVIGLFGDSSKPVDAQPAIQTIAKVLQLFDGQGRGSELASSKGTAWGLVNATTEYVDWHKGQDQSRRLDNAWFLGGALLKEKAYNNAVALLAA